MRNSKEKMVENYVDVFKLAEDDEVAKLLLYYIEHNDCIRQSVKRLIKACNRQEFMYCSPLPAITAFLPTIVQSIINLTIKDVYNEQPTIATGFIGVGCAIAYTQMLKINKKNINNNKWTIINSLENKKDKKLSDSANNVFYERIEELLTSSEYRYALMSYINRVIEREETERLLQNIEEFNMNEVKLHVDDFSYEK